LAISPAASILMKLTMWLVIFSNSSSPRLKFRVKVAHAHQYSASGAPASSKVRISQCYRKPKCAP
jgi:hypothetical protein